MKFSHVTGNDKAKAAQALGKAITMRRTELGMKRTKLAEIAALSYPYLSEIENGRKQPSAEKLRSLAAALEMDVVDLMGLAEVYEDDQAGVGAASVVSMSRTARSKPLGSAEAQRMADIAITQDLDRRGPALGDQRLAEHGEALSRHYDPAVPSGMAAISEEAIRQVVRSELERWAVDVLPILIRQEIRRFLDDDLR